MRTVDSRRPSSSVMTISCVHSVRPSTRAVQVAVTMPSVTDRLWVALISMPTA